MSAIEKLPKQVIGFLSSGKGVVSMSAVIGALVMFSMLLSVGEKKMIDNYGIAVTLAVVLVVHLAVNGAVGAKLLSDDQFLVISSAVLLAIAVPLTVAQAINMANNPKEEDEKEE